MNSRLMRRTFISALLAAVVSLTWPATSRADGIGIQSDRILPGFDLLETASFDLATQNSLSLLGLSFLGVPLGMYDFGTGRGPEATFSTDTIVQRPFEIRDGQTREIVMVARRLVTTEEVDLGFGPDFHYLTLQSERGGPASAGFLTLAIGPEPGPGLPHGTFDWLINMAFDLRRGSPTGMIVFSDTVTLSATGVTWGHNPPPFAVLIPGVNFTLNGMNGSNDIFALQDYAGLRNAAVPEPTTLMLLGTGMGIAGVLGRKRRQNRWREQCP